MKKDRLRGFAGNVALLTLTALIMRAASLYFNVYLKNKLGEDGVGLFSLIMSVYSFAVTFATAGISLLATRLVSEAIGRGRPAEIKTAMRKCFGYSLFFGVSGALILFAFSDPIGTMLLSDRRTVLSLRALAVTLPFISLSSAAGGYFTAVRRVSPNAVTQISEQFIRMGLTVAAFTFMAPPDLEYMCLFVVLGALAADVISFFISFALYALDILRHNRATSKRTDKTLGRKMLSIGLPVAFSSYFRSALVTVEHLLIPKGLRKSGLSHEQSLAQYGCLEAMALPVIMFPYAFLSPYCSMIVPEIAEKKAAEDSEAVAGITRKSLFFVCAFGVGCAAVMLSCADLIGNTVYKSGYAAEYIRLLAPLIPIMYADTLTDSILKGMDEQLYSMRVNIADSLLGVLLALTTVPMLGVKGYILNIFICEIVNFSLSFSRLASVLSLKLDIFFCVGIPLVAAVATGIVCRLSVYPLFSHIGHEKLVLFLSLLVPAVLYVLFLRMCGKFRKRRSQ